MAVFTCRIGATSLATLSFMFCCSLATDLLSSLSCVITCSLATDLLSFSALPRLPKATRPGPDGLCFFCHQLVCVWYYLFAPALGVTFAHRAHGGFMATAPKVDELSKEARSLVVYALEAFLVSQRRAEKAAKSESVRAVYAAEAVKTEDVIRLFR